MSATALGHQRRGRFTATRPTRARDAAASSPEAPRPSPAPTANAVGTVGDTVKLVVHVDTVIEAENGMRTYLVHDVETGDVLEWSSARRYGITVGETLKLSGVVASHHRSGDGCITRLRNCFNPMRVR